jgi:hypothetical protein
VKEVVAHLIIAEKTNWMTRVNIILNNPEKVFEPLDMKIHFDLAQNSSIDKLLSEFGKCRKSSINTLFAHDLKENDLKKSGIHLVTGEVKTPQIIATDSRHAWSEVRSFESCHPDLN